MTTETNNLRIGMVAAVRNRRGFISSSEPSPGDRDSPHLPSRTVIVDDTALQLLHVDSKWKRKGTLRVDLEALIHVRPSHDKRATSSSRSSPEVTWSAAELFGELRVTMTVVEG